jgi:spore cortex formation protein SpoVR/YcgB (stage V sporulation)
MYVICIWLAMRFPLSHNSSLVKMREREEREKERIEKYEKSKGLS